MSKLRKLIKSPRIFFEDARRKKAVKLVDSMNSDELKRFNKSRSPLLLVDSRKPDKKVVTSGKAVNSGKVANITRTDDLSLAQKLLNFERNFPVNSLQGGDAAPGLLLWPFFRHLFWVRCQATYKGKNAATVNTSKFYISRDWQQHYRQQLPVKKLEDVETQSCDFLFFTNLRGTEQTRIDGRIYNRITDPVFEVARTLGRAKKVEVIKSIGEIWPHREHDVELLLPPLLRQVGYAALTDYPKDFFEKVDKLLPEAKFNEKHYNDCVEWFFHQRDYYLHLLQCYNPKVVFFVGFDYHYALVCAAKQLGIETVDLQHGVQAGWSPVYNHWQAVPQQGYSLLPDTFWVWGDYDAGKIRETFGHNSDVSGVRALVGGFPWLDRQKDFVNESLPKPLHKLVEARADELGRKIGLLTLQDQTTFPLLFKQIIEQSSDCITWLIKRHPKHRNIDLSAIKGKALYGKEFDSVSFLTLIRAVDIHLTECSTAVIEADYFGVPSVVTGEQGILNYSDFIEQGTVHYIKSAEELNERLDSILATSGTSRMGVIDNSVLEQVLRDLLNKHYSGVYRD